MLNHTMKTIKKNVLESDSVLFKTMHSISIACVNCMQILIIQLERCYVITLLIKIFLPIICHETQHIEVEGY